MLKIIWKKIIKFTKFTKFENKYFVAKIKYAYSGGIKAEGSTVSFSPAIFGFTFNPSSKIKDNEDILKQSFQSPLKEAREYFEKEYLTTQLKKHHGNISKTADFIGMERSALHRKLKSLGIKGIN